ncbi:MAG: hypothetical protein P8107_07245 [Spirochaetia bacterium]
MSSEVVKKLHNLDDYQIVGFFEHFSRQVFNGLDVDMNTILEGIPDSLKELNGFSELTQLSSAQKNKKMDAAVSAPVARSILLTLAEDEQFEKLLQEALAGFKDDEMVADIILAVGAAVSMILVAATTQLKGKIFGMEIQKDKASPNMIKAVGELFKDMVPKLIGKKGG